MDRFREPDYPTQQQYLEEEMQFMEDMELLSVRMNSCIKRLVDASTKIHGGKSNLDIEELANLIDELEGLTDELC